jgi:hypothetical protein
MSRNGKERTRAEIAEMLIAAGWKREERPGRQGRSRYDVFFEQPPSTGNVLTDAMTSRSEKFPPLGDLTEYDRDLFDLKPVKMERSIDID